MNVLQVDAIEGLRAIPAGAVSLVFSDLPSGETDAPTDKAPDLGAFWPEVWRVLKPEGAAVLMAHSIRFAISVISSQSSAFRYDLIWRKSAATGFLNAKHRPLRNHEFLLAFWRDGGGRTYNAQMTEGHSPQDHSTRNPSSSVNYAKVSVVGRGARYGATDRHPLSVLDFKVVGRGPERAHHQQKPRDLLRWVVRTYTNPGDLIVDPYAGSGSAGVVSLEEGRRFVGFDTDPRFGAL